MNVYVFIRDFSSEYMSLKRILSRPFFRPTSVGLGNHVLDQTVSSVTGSLNKPGIKQPAN